MGRENFILDLTEALADFMGDYFFSDTDNRFGFLSGKPKLGLGKEGIGKERLTLVLLDVSTTAKNVDSAYDRIAGGEGDYSVTVRSPWPYQASYALIGPSLLSRDGMKDAGKMHSFLFDHRKIPDDYVNRHHLDFLEEVEIYPAMVPTSEVHSLLGSLSREQGVLGTFCAKFIYATGTEVSKEKKVTAREIHAGLRSQQP